MKINNDPFMKLRIIIASIVLTIILGGWGVYGFVFLNTNPAKILTKLSKIEKEQINNFLNKTNLKEEKNYIITLDKDKKLYLYSNLSNNKLYIYNEKDYYDFAKDITLTDNSNIYKDIINSLIDSFTLNYKIIDKNKKKDDSKDYYIYSYSLNELYPVINTLKTDKNFIDSLRNTFKLNDQNILTSLDKYNSYSIGLNIVTKGSKRDIVYYNLKIDNLFDISKEDNIISGFFLNYGFTYDKSLTIYTEKKEYHANIKEIDNSFDINQYEEKSLEEVLSIIE